MDIYWLGHSCYRIKGKSATVVVDPFSPGIGYQGGKLEADMVLVTHQHPGHNYVQAVAGEPRVVDGPGEFEVAGVFVTGIPTFHDDKNGEARGKNTVYMIEMDGLALCHLGDLGHVPTSKIVGELGKVDVLMVPVGGTTTLDPAGAAEVVRKLGPRIVTPMHYKTPAINRELLAVDGFLKELGVTDISPQPRLSVSSGNLPAGLQVVLLEYPGSKSQQA